MALRVEYRSNFHHGQYLPRAREGGLKANFLTHFFFIRVTIYPAALPHNFSSVPIYHGGRGLTANLSTLLFYQGRYLP
jgi:hypothetical protein